MPRTDTVGSQRPTAAESPTFHDRPNDSPTKTLIVALAVCLACSLLVSSAAILLRPLHLANQARERQQLIMAIVERLPGIGELFATVDARQVEAQIVDLATGNYVRTIDPQTYDPRQAAHDPQQSVAIPAARDTAHIQRRAKYAPVYLLKKDGDLKLLILSVHGSGHASALYGYLALAGDLNTIVGLSFYEHAETPGLGAAMDSQAWRHQWQGKKLRDPEGRLRIRVAKGRVVPGQPMADYEVDGLSGATRTGRGITNLLHFWLGEDGYGPYLAKLQS